MNLFAYLLGWAVIIGAVLYALKAFICAGGVCG